MSVTVREVYGKSDGKIFQDKQRPAGMLLNVHVMIQFKFKLQLTWRINKITLL